MPALVPYNPTHFPALESVFGFKKRHLEIIFGSLVAIGLSLELRALPKSLKESHNEIAVLAPSASMEITATFFSVASLFAITFLC